MFKQFTVGLAVAATLVGGAAVAANLTGAGATFPQAIYNKWGEGYKTATGNALNYQGIGSGGGIQQITAKTVEFGASDKPLKQPDLDKVGLYQFPMVIGGVVPIVNLPGVQANQIKLTGQVLGDIYLGNIKSWNDKAIAALNPGVKIPPLPITVVHRSDGSGTSFQFTSYLALKNPTWSSKVGANDAVEWPAGVGGKGNDGVSAAVKQTVGSIGYVEYFYAKQNKQTTTLVANKDGKYPLPVAANFAAAAGKADWDHAPGNYMLLLDQPGATSWPITAATFILVYKKQSNAAQGAEVLKFFDWAYKNGDATAGQLDFVPMPAAVKTMVRKQWAGITGPDGKAVYASK